MSAWNAGRLYHGADYNPDQWLDSPDILEQDIEYMKKAHFNCVSLGIFAWARLEPEEGRYEFGWMRDIIDNLHKNGIYTILATPTGAKPVWMSGKYPEICRVNRGGQRELAGHRHNHCYTSPVYREKTAQINSRLAKEFGSHPGVILWHLSNEYGGECYCPLCAEAFRGWLRSKYGTLEKLNHEWWAHFWSHTYTSWEQIHPPFDFSENEMQGLKLDWRRFVTHQTVDFMKAEIEAVRSGGSKLPVTANLMGFYDVINYFKFAQHLDVVSWDSYPMWHSDAGDPLSVAASTAVSHDLMRSVKREPWLLMESTPSMTNWSAVSRPKKPGMQMLSAMQALAHGSDSVQYFQWRKSRGASEKFHGAIVDHDCRSEHRIFKEASEVGARLEKLGELAGTVVNSDVAIIFDWENRWALENARGPRNCGIHYHQTIDEHYRPFWEMGISVDVIDMEQPLDTPDARGANRYKLIIAPLLYLYRADIARRLSDFVRRGGILVGTYWSGVVGENDLCFLGGRPGESMADVFGLYADEIDALYDGQSNSFTYQGTLYRLTELCDIVRAAGAETLAAYNEDFYAGTPALTCNAFGQGSAYYLAAKAEAAFLRVFYGQLADKLKLRPDIFDKLPRGVACSRRQSGDGKTYRIFQNFLTEGASVELKKPLTDIESGDVVRTLRLAPYGTAVLREQ